MAEFRTLKKGSRDIQVQLLQLGLVRAGYKIAIDGIFGSLTKNAVTDFQRKNALEPDGIVGEKTWGKLRPYLVGYTEHTIRAGDTVYKLAARYGTMTDAIYTANPGIIPENLQIGSKLIIPFSFDVVPDTISFTSVVTALCMEGISRRYPFVKTENIGTSVLGKNLTAAKIGNGKAKMFINASHHANEWITTPLVLKFLENYAKAVMNDTYIGRMDAKALTTSVTLYIMPLVNPDGVDLVTGEIKNRNAEKIAADFPKIPYPSGWKANIDGIDLNLQYPAGWQEAQKIKFAQGFTMPAPRDYVGTAPLTAPESRAVYDFSKRMNFDLTISYHTQGKVIYWQYQELADKKAYELGLKLAEASGYELAYTPYESSFAGYKDWFILQYKKPGYTVEAGTGTPPLPITQLRDIYRDNVGLIVTAMSESAEL